MSAKSTKKTPAEISPVMKTLATYISQAAKKPMPKNVVERTKHHTLDTMAAMVSGSRLPPGACGDFVHQDLGRHQTIRGDWQQIRHHRRTCRTGEWDAGAR